MTKRPKRKFRLESMKLNQRGIFITGANRGLGKAIARACVAEGAHVLLCARDASSLTPLVDELSAAAPQPGRILTASADVRGPATIQEAIARAVAELPNFCGLVNNAGIWGPERAHPGCGLGRVA